MASSAALHLPVLQTFCALAPPRESATMTSIAALHLPVSTAFSIFRHPSHHPLSFHSAIVPKPPSSLRNRRRFPEHSVSLPRATGPDGNLHGDSDASEQRDLLLLPSKATIVVAACTIGLLTGVGVVLFNNAVHELRDFFWDGIPSQGTSWLREEPLEEIWQRVILVPVCGGALVGIFNMLQDALQNSSSIIISSNLKGLLEPIFKAIAASITLGTGNSLGPEGPSVEIGASVAKGVGKMLKCGDKSLSLAAAGSAAGISSGFNASVAGCFFAVESVLWPSPADAYASLTNSTSMVILSAVIASVVSELGLGPVPAFTVPQYDFRTASELPLYLLLGIICGLVSLALTKCTFYAREVVEYMRKTSGIPKLFYPALGGLAVGVIALSYPEVLYWGFENVDTLLESRPLVKSLSADILLQLVGAKIIATSLARASGLVGGYYAPSLFIGAATGVAYGKFVADILPLTGPLYSLSSLEVASPQAFGLVGMGATLAGVCQVPLTSVLLLFELTQDYRIVLPLLGAVGISSWITSSQNSKDSVNKVDTSESNDVKPPPYSLSNIRDVTKDSFAFTYADEQREIKNSACLHMSLNTDRQKNLKVSQAMQIRYAAALPNSTVSEAITLMLVEKQSCALIVDEDNIFLGLLTVEDLQTCCDSAASNEKQLEVDKLLISEFCNLQSEMCQSRSVSPEESLLSARKIMDLHGLDRLPVVSKLNEASTRGYVVGLLDRQSIDTICRVMAAKELLGLP